MKYPESYQIAKYLRLIGSLGLDLNFSIQVNNLVILQISKSQSFALSKTSVVPLAPTSCALTDALFCLDFSKIASARDF